MIHRGPVVEASVGTDVNYFLRKTGRFTISTDPASFDFAAIFQFLSEANWWPNLSEQTLSLALRHSLCFSLLEHERQIGFARVITDYVTYAYLCDVFIIEERRRQGLGTWLMRSILSHPDLEPLKRISLITHTAQDFYRKLDFRFLSEPDSYMERL
jgi:ribosomal protein S18 acetylase RimI-like enzyme